MYAHVGKDGFGYQEKETQGGRGKGRESQRKFPVLVLKCYKNPGGASCAIHSKRFCQQTK